EGAVAQRPRGAVGGVAELGHGGQHLLAGLRPHRIGARRDPRHGLRGNPRQPSHVLDGGAGLTSAASAHGTHGGQWSAPFGYVTIEPKQMRVQARSVVTGWLCERVWRAWFGDATLT